MLRKALDAAKPASDRYIHAYWHSP
jgi:hypothetical protein